jgi:uncharacterized protein
VIPGIAGRVALTMVWHDLLFLHRRIAAEALRPLIPPALSVDEFDGTAWLGVVPFRMTHVRPFAIPLPGRRFAFAEINVRTYVSYRGRPGVWFLSLDAGDRLAPVAARAAFAIPYRYARVVASHDGGDVVFHARTGRYRPTSPPSSPRPGSLEAFLADRLCLYSADRSGRLWRGDIEHGPWPLQAAAAEVVEDTMAASHDLTPLEGPPLLHMARRLDVVGRFPVRVGA